MIAFYIAVGVGIAAIIYGIRSGKDWHFTDYEDSPYLSFKSPSWWVTAEKQKQDRDSVGAFQGFLTALDKSVRKNSGS